ncbi:hypothetical protein G6F64_015007 [Rhizopus arrhizus]|uniref:Uncharacterized protein n=2 Tax=Rhizopus TaxID=4842 RepID=A0A9P7C0T8_9FUNG|nr:hypothetical protein G6F64_015007 [Rhizopus arrhizus]KAG1530287.1 hypothetical protein G6F50_017420 [Rhizopus delemar]
MPDSMTSAAVGVMVYVNGSRMEMAASTPMPGSTPIRLPMNTPNTAHIRLSSANATENPCIRLLKISIDQPQRNNGNCNCSAHENTATPRIVTPTASRAALRHVC